MTTKKHTATLLVLVFIGLAGLVNAQTYSTIKAQVPFKFVANGETMPAGECTIQILVAGRTTLSIRSGMKHAYALPVADESPNARKETALVFHRYNGRYFLAGIKHEGVVGYTLPVSKFQNELRARGIDEEVLTILASAK